MTSQIATLQGQVITRSRRKSEARISSRPKRTCLASVLALALTASSARTQQDIDLTGYTLVFEDSFDELSVGSHRGKGDAKWGDWMPDGPAGAFSFSHWMGSFPWAIPDVCNIDNGVLRLWTKWYESLGDSGGRNWISGMIASMDVNRNGFAQRFGYWSARMKMPNAGQGAWSAFWLASVSEIPSAGSKGYEVDIVEAYGGQFKEAPGGDKYNWVVHPWNVDGSQASQPYEGGEWEEVPGGDAINNWHIYGCKVGADFITFYIDGQEVGRKPTDLEYLEEPLYIIINYALQQPLSGEPFVSKGTSALQVDWVRAYSLPNDSASTPTAPPTNLRIP
jgi:beta-glucanase (GH16 family)